MMNSRKSKQRIRRVRSSSAGMGLLSAFASVAVAVASPTVRFSAMTQPMLASKRTSLVGNNQLASQRTGLVGNNHARARWLQQLTASLGLRGGSSDPASYDHPPQQPQYPYESQEYMQQQQQAPPQQQQQPPQAPPQQQQQQRQQPQQTQYEYPPPPQDYDQQQMPPLDIDNDDVPFHETFQERVDNWRNYQIEHSAEQKSSLSPRDEKGRMKLFVSISKASRSITFFLLMWRNVHLYEVVDQKFKSGTLRLLAVFPLTLLFIANMAGVVASLTTPGHKSKKRLKAILNLDKLVEFFLIFWHISQLLFTTSHLVPKEIYISHILHSVFFIMQCQTVTRFVWDEALPLANPEGGPSRQRDEDDVDEDPEPMQQQYSPYSAGDVNEQQQNPHGY